MIELKKHFNYIRGANLEGEDNIEALADASKNVVCVVLLQQKRLIFCASKVLNVSQRNWATIERELFAILWDVKNCVVLCMACTSKFILIINHWSAFSKRLEKFQTTVRR